MEHSRCDDTVVARQVSPDKAHVATLYHSRCSSGSTFTYVKLEESPQFPRWWSNDYDYILSLLGAHPIQAEWLDNTHLVVKTPGIQNQDQSYLTAHPPKTEWKGIHITFK